LAQPEELTWISLKISIMMISTSQGISRSRGRPAEGTQVMIHRHSYHQNKICQGQSLKCRIWMLQGALTIAISKIVNTDPQSTSRMNLTLQGGQTLTTRSHHLQVATVCKFRAAARLLEPS
jgi:hypothetical protein